MVIYLGLATTVVLVLRSMSRRFRRQAELVDSDVPYGREPLRRRSRRRSPSVDDAVAVVLFVAVSAYAVFGGADFGAGSGTSSPAERRGARPRALIDHSVGPVWEANHVWLIFALVVLWTGFPEAFASITLTLFVPLTLVALGIVLRGASFAFRKSALPASQRRVTRRSLRVLVRGRPVLHGRPAASPRAGSRPAVGPATRGYRGEPDAIPVAYLYSIVAYLAAVYLVWSWAAWATRRCAPALRCALAAAAVAGVAGRAASSCWPPTPTTSSTASRPGLAARRDPVERRARGHACSPPAVRQALPGPAPAAAVAPVVVAWGVGLWDYEGRESPDRDAAAALSGTIAAAAMATAPAVGFIVPAFGPLYVDQGVDRGRR